MILSRFLSPRKPKWQNSNPAVRSQAVEELTREDPVLLQLAQDDQEPEVRRSALGKINDLALLHKQAENDPAETVRAYAGERLLALLSGQDAAAPELSQRLQLTEQLATPALLQQLVREAAEPELRLAALTCLDQEADYIDRAVHDASAQVRWEA
jgi:hypothetical protein